MTPALCTSSLLLQLVYKVLPWLAHSGHIVDWCCEQKAVFWALNKCYKQQSQHLWAAVFVNLELDGDGVGAMRVWVCCPSLQIVIVCSVSSWGVEPLLSALLRRMPDLEALEIVQLVNCPESFTPDMRCIMGESPNVQGYFVLAGMNSAGTSFGGGAGK